MIAEYLEKKHRIDEGMDKYKKLVSDLLKKYKVDSPKKLSKEDKLKYFKELDALWISKEEKDQLKECFDYWKKNNNKFISEQYKSIKRNIDIDNYNRILFEQYIVDKKVYDIDYPLDYETWLSLDIERLQKNYNNLEQISKDGRSFDAYCKDEYTMQLLPNWAWIDADMTNKPAGQQYFNKF